MTFLGVIGSTDGCVFCCDQSCIRTPTPTPQFDEQGRRVFNMRTGQFVIVVEGMSGLSKATPGMSLQAAGGDGRPDLWIESTQPLGNGSAAVCDTGPKSLGGGGVPAIAPTPDFSEGNQMITNALLDFACRFDNPPATTSSNACTLLDPTRQPAFVAANTTIQFCDFVGATALFPPAESIVTVQLRDVLGNLGPTAQIVVRVATPTPTP